MSILLILHILASTLGYLLFGTAFACACLYLYRSRRFKTKQVALNGGFPWSLGQLDRTLLRSLKAGVVLLGAGLVLGLAVQNALHGAIRPTSPRFLFPLCLWFFYLAVVAFRLWTGLGGKVQAHLTAWGLLCAIVSFVYELRLVQF